MQKNDYFYENYYKNIENFKLNLVLVYHWLLYTLHDSDHVLLLELSCFGSYRLVFGVQADWTINNQYFLKTLTNIDEFFRFRKFRLFYNFNYFQFNKYANLICKN